jgi:predicted RNA binding protein YcfA (HicA-like mRNA interferase family)
MSRTDKQVARMRTSPAGGWRYSQLTAALARAGFHEVSSRGSHRTWIGPGGVRLTLKDDGRRALLPEYVRRRAAALDAAERELGSTDYG